MNTWTSKRVCGVLLVMLAGGCTEDVVGSSFSTQGGAVRAAPPSRVALANGAVTLVAPEGYCIDARSVRPDFALIARCDTLGGRNRRFGAPLAVVTASLASGDAANGAVESLPSEPDIIVSQRHTAGLKLLEINGPPPLAGAGHRYWRGLGQIGGHAVGLAVYTPQDTPELGQRGAEMLTQIMQRSAQATAAAKSIQPVTPKPESPEQRPSKKGLGETIAGLFQ